MSTDQNKELVRSFFSDVMNGQNVDAADQLFSDDFVNHGMPTTKPGVEGFKEIAHAFIGAFPDINIQLDLTMAEGDIVANRGYFTGTNNGSFMGMPATGKQVQVNFIDMWKIQDGKCSENWVVMDIAGLMQQLGATPS